MFLLSDADIDKSQGCTQRDQGHANALVDGKPMFEQPTAHGWRCEEQRNDAEPDSVKYRHEQAVGEVVAH